MIDYENLSSIAAEFNIKRGDTESETNFNARVIYSAVCRLSYASLWERTTDDESTIPIVRFKNMIAALAKFYGLNEVERLSDKIYEHYLQTGAFYHKRHRISASISVAAECNGILFLRGVRPNQKVFMIGEGFYLPSDDQPLSINRRKNLEEMFGLSKKILPPIKFKADGAIVRAKIPWLPPSDVPLPTELFLWKLYGWKNYSRRIFDAQVFFALKNFFESRNQKFEEE